MSKDPFVALILEITARKQLSQVIDKYSGLIIKDWLRRVKEAGELEKVREQFAEEGTKVLMEEILGFRIKEDTTKELMNEQALKAAGEIFDNLMKEIEKE